MYDVIVDILIDINDASIGIQNYLQNPIWFQLIIAKTNKKKVISKKSEIMSHFHFLRNLFFASLSDSNSLRETL